MVSQNNPAGRLHHLLGRLRAAEQGVSIIEAWAQILEDSPDQTRARLGGVAGLVSQIDVAVESPERQAVAAPVRRYRNEWMEAIFPLRHSFAAGVEGVKPSDVAHEALGSVAAYMEAVAPDGTVPTEKQRSELLASIHALAEELGRGDELPEDVARLIARRLSGVETAIHHIQIGGPDSVRLAAEALMGAALASGTTQKIRRASTTKRVTLLARAIWVDCSSEPIAQKAIDAWPEVAQELAGGSRQTVWSETSPEVGDAAGEAGVSADDDGEATDPEGG
jgi:hypothetical protein